MLQGINPLLHGDILKLLDEMGHSDRIAIVDANFPAHRVGKRVIETPGVDIVSMLQAVRSIMPLDSSLPPVLMQSGGDEIPQVQREILSACQETKYELVERWEYYNITAEAYAVIATGEARLWANVILAKGIPTTS